MVHYKVVIQVGGSMRQLRDTKRSLRLMKMNFYKPDPIMLLAIFVAIGIVVTTLVRPGNQEIYTVVKAHAAQISAQNSSNYIRTSNQPPGKQRSENRTPL